MTQSMICAALDGLPEICVGDDLAALTVDYAARANFALRDGDVVVLCQKIVSKAEGRLVRLDSVAPSARAEELANLTQKDPRLVELVLQEADSVVRARPGVLIVRHRLGFTVANAGVDQSNLPDGSAQALLLPANPDESARVLATEIRERTGKQVAVIINDSFGRPWRRGTCGVAIGCYGLEALKDLRGKLDRSGRALMSSEVALADEVAAAASLMMGQAGEGRPIVVIRGMPANMLTHSAPAAALLRPQHEDLFQ